MTGRLALLILALGLLLGGCSRPAPATPTPTPDILAVHSVATVRDLAAAWQGQRVTVRGIVTSVDDHRATLQSDGAGLLLEGASEAHLAQEVITTGTLSDIEGNLALVDLEEWLVEDAQATLPEAQPLTPEMLEDSRYVRLPGGTVEAGGVLRWQGGAVRLRGLDQESQGRLAEGTRLDWVSGVLRRAGGGWALLPPHPRDIVLAPPRHSLCQIQGTEKGTLLSGRVVETTGIVTMVMEEGWFLQHPDCDDDPMSSDALWVASESASTPEIGQLVRLRGRVEESFGRTQIQLEEEAWQVEEEAPLPEALPLAPPAGDERRAERYWESLEGMLVSLEDGLVVGPTSRFGEFALVPEGTLSDGRLWPTSGALTQRVVVADDPLNPAALSVGDRVTGLVGSLDFTFGNFKVRPLEPFEADTNPLPTPPLLPPAAEEEWRLATLNLENLFDTEDDPLTDDDDWTLTAETLNAKLDKLATTISGPLALPTILAVQEVETLELLQQLADHPTLEGRYEAVLLEGVDGRGIDVGLLVEASRVTIDDHAATNPCSSVGSLGGGPATLCPEGQRPLFARPPLVATLRVDEAPLTVIVVHFKSRRGGEMETQPRRSAQARFVAELVTRLRTEHPEVSVAVLGDFNDGAESVTLTNLTEGSELQSLWPAVPAERRYNYVFEGVSQILDHILVTPDLAQKLHDFTPLPLNADYPHQFSERPTLIFRSSDHDPLVATFGERIENRE